MNSTKECGSYQRPLYANLQRAEVEHQKMMNTVRMRIIDTFKGPEGSPSFQLGKFETASSGSSGPRVICVPCGGRMRNKSPDPIHFRAVRSISIHWRSTRARRMRRKEKDCFPAVSNPKRSSVVMSPRLHKRRPPIVL